MADGSAEIEKIFVIAGTASAGSAKGRNQLSQKEIDQTPKEIEKASKKTDNSDIKKLGKQQEKAFKNLTGEVGSVTTEIATIETDFAGAFEQASTIEQQTADIADAVRVKTLEGEAPKPT